MVCPYCGSNLKDDSKQCYACGVKFESAEQQNVYANNNQQSNNNQSSNNINPNNFNNEKSKSGIPVLIGFFLFICLLCYLMFFTGGGSNNEQNEPNNTESSNTANNNTQQPLPDNSITDVKKQSYIRLANAFVSSVRNEVNMGAKLGFYETNAMILVPVGDRSKCAILENNDTSPFSKTWNYAYVGAKYDGIGYSYYFISEDGSNIGIEFISANKMNEDNVYSSYSETNISKEISDKLIKLYSINSNEELTDGDILNLIKLNDNTIKKVVVISAKAGCRYR